MVYDMIRGMVSYGVSYIMIYHGVWYRYVVWYGMWHSMSWRVVEYVMACGMVWYRMCGILWCMV